MLLLLGVVLIFGAIVCLVIGMSSQQESALASRIAGLRNGGRSDDLRPIGDQRGSMSSRMLAPAAASIGGRMTQMMPTRWVGGIESRLIQAGEPTTLNGFLFAVALILAATVGVAFMVLTKNGGSTTLFLSVGLVVLGVMMPKVWLDNRVRHRQVEVLKSLPDAFDLVTVCVEAGLGLEAALARVSEKVSGPFGEELAVTLREVSLGKLRREALREMAERMSVGDLTTFVNAVIQAESMGTSIATVLRVQAEQMRIKRRQRAEQQAQKAPIKMMFPLVLCIFPSLFIVILGPAGISIYENFISQ